MPGVIVVGAQWGDEGKGKIIDILSKEATYVVRAQGGNNAGHTVLIGTDEYKIHLVPSGILFPHTQCYIGGGTVIDPEVLLEEIEMLESRGIQVKGRLHISLMAHVIFPYHKIWDEISEERKKEYAIGTTKKGIGPCYADKINRIGIRFAELISPDTLYSHLKRIVEMKNQELSCLYNKPLIDFERIFEQYKQFGMRLLPYVKNIEKNIYDALSAGENVLFEGAQGTFLDVTFGTYPYVTSSQTIAAGICSGAGIGPTQIDHTIGIVKAYTTRVGHGPFVTEIDITQNALFDHNEAREVGTTTGRKRRIGWFDVPLVRQSIRLNGIDSIALMKLDILDAIKEIPVCVGYKLNGMLLEDFPVLQEDLEKICPHYEIMPGWQCSTRDVKSLKELPENALKYIKKLEGLLDVPIQILSLGPERERTLIIKNVFN